MSYIFRKLVWWLHDLFSGRVLLSQKIVTIVYMQFRINYQLKSDLNLVSVVYFQNAVKIHKRLIFGSVS